MTQLSVLYVDDDADIRTIVQMSLGLDPSIAVRVAASGQEGLAMLAQGPRPDVVILDVMMPGLDGPHVLNRMRGDPATAAVPVIFMTAKGRQADVEGYLERGAIGVILKPFDPVQLAAQVRDVLYGDPADRAEA